MQENEYFFKKSKKAKQISVTVKSDGGVLVRHPAWMPKMMVRQFVRSKQDWIDKKLMKLRLSHPKATGLNKDTVYFVGVEKTLRVSRSKNKSVVMYEDKVVVSGPKTDQKTVMRQLVQWYKDQAADVFLIRLQLMSGRFGLDTVPELKIKNLKSRWGSMSHDNIMTLSIALLAAPTQALDQVIAHELVHLTIKNHSKDFYTKLEQHYPNWKEHKKLLIGKYMLK